MLKPKKHKNHRLPKKKCSLLGAPHFCARLCKKCIEFHLEHFFLYQRKVQAGMIFYATSSSQAFRHSWPSQQPVLQKAPPKKSTESSPTLLVWPRYAVRCAGSTTCRPTGTAALSCHRTCWKSLRPLGFRRSGTFRRLRAQEGNPPAMDHGIVE